MGSDEQTAAEFLKELENDAAYQKMMAEKERERLSLVDAIRKDEQSLVADLRIAGVAVESVSDLVNSSEPYPAAIPVLVRHLSQAHCAEVREAIVRALIVPESKGVATNVLLRMFKDENSEDFKWSVAQALVASSTRESVDTIMELIRDRQHGRSRGPLLGILRHVDKSVARAVLAEFLNDPETRADAEEVAREL